MSDRTSCGRNSFKYPHRLGSGWRGAYVRARTCQHLDERLARILIVIDYEHPESCEIERRGGVARFRTGAHPFQAEHAAADGVAQE